MERKLKAALVGVGSMGRGHLDNYVKFLKEDSPIQIVALCDVDEKKFTNYKADFNLGEVGADGYDFNMFRLYNDLDKMLEAETDLDMVTIALPTYLHCWGACKCMEKGINVLSEKPMALTVEQCEEMIACAKKNNVRLMIGQCLRFAPAYLKLKEIIDSGELGEVYFGKTAYVRRRGTPYGWFTDKKTSGGGPIIDIGIHGIDAAWYLMGNPKPVRISAQISNRIGDYQTKGVDRWIGTKCPDNRFDTEDSGCGVIHFENGACLMFEASWAINGPAHSDTLICGTKAGVSLDPFKVYGERNGYLSDDAITMNDNNRFASELTHFYDCVLNDKEPIYPIEQAILMQKMLNGIYESAEKGKEVEIV